MAIAILMKGGGSGSGSDDVTASKAQVLQGYTAVTSDSDDEPAAGTMPNRGTDYQTPRNMGWDTSRGILWTQIEKGYYGDPAGDNNYVWKDSTSARSQLGITAGKILAGQNIGGLAGTATSDADASAGYIYSGKTAYVNGAKITGSMSVSSLVSFSTATYSTTQITASWQWPWTGPYSGIAICGKTGGYPENIWDSRVYTGHGNNYNLGASTSAIIGGLQPGQTYYFRAWIYCSTSAGELYSGYSQAAAATKPQGQQIFTSSGTFTVPANVTSIDVFCVGGGGGGMYSSINSKYTMKSGGGGGGGYTASLKNISVSPGQTYAVTVGAGGVRGYREYVNGDWKYNTAKKGSESSFGSLITGNGGNGGSFSYGGLGGLAAKYGGNGGSAGGGGYTYSGASDGGNTHVYNTQYGCGQGTTTRAFGEGNNTLYAGGGGAGSWSNYDSDGGPGAGGAGGGGAGDGGGYNGNLNYYGGYGTPNTGGGGGGSSCCCSDDNHLYGGVDGGNGGSGVVIVRWGY